MRQLLPPSNHHFHHFPLAKPAFKPRRSSVAPPDGRRLTSAYGHRLLQDADVELQGQLGRRAQEGLDDWGAGEGRSVSEQFPLRLAHLPLHLLRLSHPRHLLLPGDADVRLLHAAHAAIDAERLQAPAGRPKREKKHSINMFPSWTL